MATPKLAMIPTAYKAGKLYSVLPQSGVGDFTFARASAATRVNEDGLIETINPNFIGNELVTNGDFATDSDWNKGTGWSISGGVASCDGTQTGNSGLTQNNVFENNKKYKITFDLVSNGQEFKFWVNGTQYISSFYSSNTYNLYINTNTSGRLYFEGTSNFVGSIDNVSVKEVTINNIPRLDYTDGGCPNFLLEPQRTNLITYSEDFSQWNGAQFTTPNYAISPDGTQNASRLLFTGASQILLKTTSLASGVSCSATFYVKGNAGETIQLAAGGVDTMHTLSGSWQRLETNQTSVNSNILLNTFGGSTARDLLIWGAQLEQGSYPTSYIPTNGSTVTRVGETCNGSGDAATFNDSEGVFMAEISALADDGTFRNIGINGAPTNVNEDRIVIYFRDTANIINFGMESGNSSQFFSQFPLDVKLNNKLALKYSASSCSFWINGFEVGEELNKVMPTGLSRLDFNLQNGGDDFYGNTKQIQYYDSVLTDSELETLTSWQSFLEMANAQNYTII